MGYLELYNYSDQYSGFDLDVGLGSYAEIATIEAGQVEDQYGNTWTITKNIVNNSTVLEFTCNNKIVPSGTQYDIIKRNLGLGSLEYEIDNSLPVLYEEATVFNNELGWSSNTQSEPYVTIAKSSFVGDRYTYSVNYHQNNYSYAGSVTTASDSYVAITPIGFKLPGDQTIDCKFGFYSFYSTDPGSTTIRVQICDNVNNVNFAEYNPEKGEEGFNPIKIRNNRPGGGGNRSGQKPNFNTDTLTQPGEPNETKASVAGAGFINVYKITQYNLDQLSKMLFSENILTFLNNIFINPMDACISLNIFPCTPYLNGSEAIKLLNFSGTVLSAGVDCNGFPLSKQYRTYDFQTLNVAEMYESYLDYSASSFELYLPFIGSVDIPVDEVMDGSINVQYTIDFFTGACVANVLCKKSVLLGSGDYAKYETQHSYQGNCAIQVPFTAVTYGNIVASLINVTASGIKSGPGGAIATGLSDAFNGGFQAKAITKGTVTSNGGYCAILYPYITVTRPITAEPESFQEVMGYPSYIDNTLGTCKGLCVCDNINLSNLPGATDDEINRIKQICLEGIYI